MAYKKIEQYDDAATIELGKNYKEVIRLIGEDPEREGLLKTPERIAKAMQYATQGYNQDAHAIIWSTRCSKTLRMVCAWSTPPTYTAISTPTDRCLISLWHLARGW